jgi:hypothetical protein
MSDFADASIALSFTALRALVNILSIWMEVRCNLYGREEYLPEIRILPEPFQQQKECTPKTPRNDLPPRSADPSLTNLGSVINYMTSNQSRNGWCMPLNKASLSTSLPENQDKYDDENNDAK